MVSLGRGIAAVGASAAAAALGFALSTVTAGAVSGGGYDPTQMHCSKSADRNDQPTKTQKGCKNFVIQLNQGDGAYAQKWHLLEINSDQLPDNTFLHSGSVVLDPGQGNKYSFNYELGTAKTLGFFPVQYVLDIAGWIQDVAGGKVGPPPVPNQNIPPTVGTPSLGMTQSKSKGHLNTAHPLDTQVWLGADDNLNNGEHDGVNPNPDPTHPNRDKAVSNGPSDGGAMQYNVHPKGDPTKPQTLAQNVDPTDTHNPLRAADAGTGACADGVCAAADTTHRQVYKGGCHDCPAQEVYNDQYSTKWRSPDCNSGSTANQNQCGSGWNTPGGSKSGPISQPYKERGAFYTDPGVMIYEDPDPQSSPVLPMYPVCEEYVGTQGVYVCGNNVVPAPPTGKSAGHSAPASGSATSHSAQSSTPTGVLPPLMLQGSQTQGLLPPINSSVQPMGVLPPLMLQLLPGLPPPPPPLGSSLPH